MSWDVFIQDIPDGIKSVNQIPEDFRPGNVGSRKSVLNKLKQLVPDADFSDESWIVLDRGDYSVEFNIGTADPVNYIALHIRGSSKVLKFLNNFRMKSNWKLIDSSTGDVICSEKSASKGFMKWKMYLESVL